MLLDLDRYYTPEHVARKALERASFLYSPSVCADSTCGTGRLLKAANDVFGHVNCVGIDRDKRAIAELRQKNPDWVLAIGDLLSEKNCKNKFLSIIPEHVDLLILNPPFSHGNRKSVDIVYNGENLKGSVAMAHLLKSFELFRPAQGAVVIVPESLLYSETDTAARAALAKHYSLNKIADLESCTFRGARAHASVIQISSALHVSTPTVSSTVPRKIFVAVTRGGLPVHVMKESKGGVPYVHTTDIRKVITGTARSQFLQTFDTAKGRITGWAVLVPRVGMPEMDLIRAVKFRGHVQLSDCVIALECSNKVAALQVEERIKLSWDSFRQIYKGTGARYVTLSRLRTWLAERNIREE